MPDLQQYALTPQGTATFNNVPRATIAARVVDSQTGALIVDLTGANAIPWPAEWGALTAAERLELGDVIARWLIARRVQIAQGG